MANILDKTSLEDVYIFSDPVKRSNCFDFVRLRHCEEPRRATKQSQQNWLFLQRLLRPFGARNDTGTGLVNIYEDVGLRIKNLGSELISNFQI